MSSWRACGLPFNAASTAQAFKYQLALESRFELLTQFPRMGSPTYDLRQGLYRFRYKSHMIFYTSSAENIVVVRMLPASADFKRHFASNWRSRSSL
jgi:plasmid stabilization system protein ParE